MTDEDETIEPIEVIITNPAKKEETPYDDIIWDPYPEAPTDEEKQDDK